MSCGASLGRPSEWLHRARAKFPRRNRVLACDSLARTFQLPSAASSLLCYPSRAAKSVRNHCFRTQRGPRYLLQTLAHHAVPRICSRLPVLTNTWVCFEQHCEAASRQIAHPRFLSNHLSSWDKNSWAFHLDACQRSHEAAWRSRACGLKSMVDMVGYPSE